MKFYPEGNGKLLDNFKGDCYSCVLGGDCLVAVEDVVGCGKTREANS